MLRYVGKRIVYIIGVFFLISLIMFTIYNSIPGDRALTMVAKAKDRVTAEQFEVMYQNARAQLGMDDPLPIRYVKWITNIFRGDLGYSTVYRKDVVKVLPDPMKNTVFINIFATILALGISIPLGIWCAVKKFSRFDNTVQVLTIVGYSIPGFVIGLLLMFLFSVELGWFPLSGMNSPNFQGTGLAAFGDRMLHLALPLTAMTLASLGGMTRYVRAAMIDSLRMDYIRTARAKGLREKVVIYSHAWRNALLPVITLIFGWFIGIFGGSVIIETLFQLNGMGKLYWNSLLQQDYDVALATQILYVVMSLVGNLIIDLSYGLVDPRVRIDK